MINRFFKNTFLFVLITIVSCGRSTGQNEISDQKTEISTQSDSTSSEAKPRILVGAEKIEKYLPLLRNKRIGIVGNQTSVTPNSNYPDSKEKKYTHLVDTLIALKINVVRVFAPEHGFRGTADAGETVKDGKDSKTGLPIISLYGDNKKPKPEQLKDIDILVFDLQDVGARFYTYISSLHYVMEASAENNIPLLVLDRPNPNGHYTDGPVLNPKHQSFVGMHPVPVVHGLTMGEYAQMINGEKWLKNEVKCDLQVIEMTNYDHTTSYSLPVKPSPNLPNDQAINLYPSLCFFEGTNVNAGRGTNTQFQVFGSPFLKKAVFDYTYTPQSMEGAKNPKHLGQLCYGRDLQNHPKVDRIKLSWLIEAYNNTSDKSQFFNSFFTKLAGNTELQKQIEGGLSEEQIRESWQINLEKFKADRAKYLLY